MKYLSVVVCGFAMLSISGLSLAQGAGDAMVQQQIQMHENMVKIHQNAIVCLKANKPTMECQEQFRQQMMDFMQQQQKMMQGMMQQPGQSMPAAPMSGQMQQPSPAQK